MTFGEYKDRLRQIYKQHIESTPFQLAQKLFTDKKLFPIEDNLNSAVNNKYDNFRMVATWFNDEKKGPFMELIYNNYIANVLKADENSNYAKNYTNGQTLSEHIDTANSNLNRFIELKKEPEYIDEFVDIWDDYVAICKYTKGLFYNLIDDLS